MLQKIQFLPAYCGGGSNNNLFFSVQQNDVDLTAAEDLRIEIRNYESIIKLCELSKDMDTKGSCLLEIGVCYYRLGDFEKAIHYFDLYLEIVKEMGDRNGEGVAYGKLGIAYSSLGDLKTSIHYQKLRLEIAKESGNIDEEGLAYNSLGLDYTRLGYFKEAIHYQELFLENSKKVENGTGVGVVRAYGSLGNNYHNLGDFKKAVKYHELSLKIAKEAGDREGEGSAYCGLGNDYESLGDFEKAIQYCELGLDVFKELGDSFEEGRAYGYLGSVFYRLGDSEKAIKYNQLCLANARCVGDTFREGETCNSLGCIFTSLGSLPQAGHYFQSSLKALSDARARLHFEDEWKINLNHVYQDVCSNLWNLLLDHNKVEEALVAAEQGRAQALKDLMEFKYKFKVSHDAYGSNTLDEATVATLASQPENTVTVFVAFAQQRVYFWIIEKGKDVKLRSYKNSETNFVDATTFMTSLRETAFETIGARDGVKCEDRSFDKQRDEDLADQKPNQSLPQFLSPQSNPLQTLYNVFIGPIADLIRGRKEIIIVPEGPLSLVPFVALITPNSKYLCESLRIRLIPSLTSLKLITNSPKDYHCNTGALLVGDPWVQEVVTYKLKQLPCAREEVEMIARILNTDPLIGEEATKDEVLKRLSTVALVHIAAHGRMENGEIALAPNLSRSSQTPTEEDFILTMTDVLHAKLRAKLVVLSCCHSGRGEIKSEGVVGIARAFLGAGTRSVLVSLWAIDDKATLEFMKSFYKQLVEGRSAGESLQTGYEIHERISPV